MGYIIQGSCFKFLRAPSHVKQNMHFDTFFIKISQKWEGAAQKTELDEGVQGGSENYYLCYYLSFTPPSYQCWSWYVCFPGQGIHFVRFHGLGLWPILKCVKILRARFYFIWAGALSSLKHHLFISPGKLPFLERLPHSGKTFPLLERWNTACLSNSATLLHIPLRRLYFTSVKNGSLCKHE